MDNLLETTYDVDYKIYENNDSLKKYHIIPLGKMLQCLNNNYTNILKKAYKNELRNSVPIGVNFMVKIKHYGDLYNEHKIYYIHSVSPDKYIKHYECTRGIVRDCFAYSIGNYLKLLNNDKNLELIHDCKIIISDKQYELYKKITQ